MNRNQLVIRIIQNISEKKHQKVHQLVGIKKALVLIEKRSLKVEMIDQKTSPLKSIVKKELKSKIF